MRSRRIAPACAELDARVHAVGLAVILGDVRGDLLAGGDEDLDRVGQVELALDVLRLQLLERGPELVGAEDVDRRVDLADRALVVGRVGSFGDPQHGAVGAADDPAVDARVGRLGGQDRGRGLLAVMRLDESLEELGRQQRRVAGEHEHVSGVVAERLARDADGVARAERRLLNRDRDAAVGELVAPGG